MAMNFIDRIGQLFSDPGSAWDNFKNGRTNEVNEDIASQNLEYQRERNTIEDARYADETAWNRAWATEERDYNRALQQQLFDREDTAFIRQAEQLSAMGINPAAQQLNGAGAGQPITSATPAAQSARSGSALHNDFQMQDTGVLTALAPLVSLASTINQVATGEGQRDLLQTQIDKQKLDNFIKASQFGLTPDFMKGYKDFKSSDQSGNLWFNMEGYNQFNKNRLDQQSWSINDINRQDLKRELDFRKNSNFYKSAPDLMNKINYFVSDSFFESAERALTRGAQLFDKAFNNADRKDDKKQSAFQKFFNLFF